MYKVYMIESEPVYSNQIKKGLQDYCDIRICQETEKALLEIVDYRPDLVIMDMTMTGLEILSLIDHIYLLGVRSKIVASTGFMMEVINERLTRYDAGVVVPRPYSSEYIIKLVYDSLSSLEPGEESMVRRLANDSLLLLGFGVHQQGYKYLLDALVYAVDHMDCLLSGELYPMVAKKFRVNAMAVEKAIRTCIEKAYKLRDDRIWGLYFPRGNNGKTRHVTSNAFLKRMALAINQATAYNNGHSLDK